MDFSTAQRKPVARYGKKQSKVSTYNFFDAGRGLLSTSSTAGRLPISPESPNLNNVQVREFSVAEPDSPSRATTRTSSPGTQPAHITSHSPVLSNDTKSGSVSSIMNNTRSNNLPDKTSTFDLLNSDDEHTSQRPPKKRRLEKPKTIAKKEQTPAATSALVEKPVDAMIVDKESSKDVSDGKSHTPTLLKNRGATRSNARTQPAAKVARSKQSSIDTSKPTRKESVIESRPTQTKPIKITMDESRVPTKPKTIETAQEDVEDPAGSKPLTKTRRKENTSAKVNVTSSPKKATKAAQSLNKPAVRVKAKTKKSKDSRHLGPLNDILRVAQLNNDQDVEMKMNVKDDGENDNALAQPKPLTPGTETPKSQKRHTYESDASVKSPSRLGIRELRLTPELESHLRRASTSSSTSPAPTPQRQGRARRIDLLDAPASVPAKSPAQSATASRSVSRHRRKPAQINSLSEPQSLLSKPQLGRTNSSQGRQTYGRAKNTFGKERSHLKDMVDDLDMISGESSQEASQQLASQLVSSSQPSQLQMQFDLDDSSSDDAAVGGKLKSIHELRQAGANSRYERDLESILDDIDPRSKSVSRISKLQGLMKLFKRMAKERNFESFVADHAIDRLTTWSQRSIHVDRLVVMLYDMISWRLIHSKSITPRQLGSILVAITASTATISNLNTLAQTARDPKEKLAKPLLKDLQAFEATVLSEKMLPSYPGDRIVPAAMTIAALNDSLRKLVQGGSRNITMGKTAYEGVIAILRRASQVTVDQELTNTFVTKCALSLLQTFTGPLESNLELSTKAYIELGNTLGDIVDHGIDRQEDLVHTVLHFAISLCNDRPAVCEDIIRSKLPVSLLKIIDQRFLTLVNAAQDGAVDSVVLDSIILSLACLLNITEYNNQVRRDFAMTDSATHDHTTTLANIYINAAPQLTQAATAEQSQVSVAFGYLSLLICNLCLDEIVWTHMSEKLSPTISVSDVVVSAKTLLINLRTLEMAQLEGEMSMLGNDNGAMDGFTSRFEQIIAAVRHS